MPLRRAYTPSASLAPYLQPHRLLLMKLVPCVERACSLAEGPPSATLKARKEDDDIAITSSNV